MIDSPNFLKPATAIKATRPAMMMYSTMFAPRVSRTRVEARRRGVGFMARCGLQWPCHRPTKPAVDGFTERSRERADSWPERLAYGRNAAASARDAEGK